MICNLCPRKCNSIRDEAGGNGFCGMGTLPVVARVAPHFGEEPCISGTKGSGTVFFSGCTMKCIYCQNYEISAQHIGRAITPAELADCYKRLEEQGVHNINLVSADHFVLAVIESLNIYKPKIPIVYNCSGYTSLDALKLLDGTVDIYLPDFKYCDDSLAVKYSSAPKYVSTACSAIEEMLRQTSSLKFDEDGIMQKGVIIRHLVLPSHTKNSLGVISLIKEKFDNRALFSLMCQYVPYGQAVNHEKLNRKITRREYAKVKDALLFSELDGFTQDMASADTKYIPVWDF